MNENEVKQKFVDKYGINMWRHITESLYGGYKPKTPEEEARRMRNVVKSIGEIFNLK